MEEWSGDIPRECLIVVGSMKALADKAQEVDGDRAVPHQPSEVDTEQVSLTVSNTAVASSGPPSSYVTSGNHNIVSIPPQEPMNLATNPETSSHEDSQYSSSYNDGSNQVSSSQSAVLRTNTDGRKVRPGYTQD